MLSDYENQVLRLKSYNRTVAFMTSGLVIVLMVIVIAYGYYQQKQTADQLRLVEQNQINAQLKQADNIEVNLKLNKSQVCILSIPAITRSQTDIEKCLKKYGARGAIDL